MLQVARLSFTSARCLHRSVKRRLPSRRHRQLRRNGTGRFRFSTAKVRNNARELSPLLSPWAILQSCKLPLHSAKPQDIRYIRNDSLQGRKQTATDTSADTVRTQGQPFQ